MWVGIRGGQSDFKYLSQQLAVTPLFSHAANADRRGDTTQGGSTRIAGHSSLRSRLSSVTPRTQTGGVTHPGGSTRIAGDRNYASHSLRSATTRYGLQSRSPSRDTHISRNYVTVDNIIVSLIEPFKGIGATENKLIQAHTKADHHNPSSPDAA